MLATGVCASVVSAGLRSIIQIVATLRKIAWQAGGHLRKCFSDHHFDKAIFPTTLSTEIRKNVSFLSTSSHLHTYRPIIIVIIFITRQPSLPSSPFPRQISLVGHENWASNLRWQAEVGEGQ